MTYSKQTWANDPGGGTPISATRLNHIEDGIESAHTPANVLRSQDFVSINAMFTAADALNAPCVMMIAPGSYSVAPLRIDKPGIHVSGYGATLTLANGSNANLLTIGPAAQHLNIEGIIFDANGSQQTGTSHGIHFEEYTGGFRTADRSNIMQCDIINALTDGVRIEPKRMQVQLRHCSIRTANRYGFACLSTDCAFDHGAIGFGVNCVYIDGAANWIRNSGLYSATNYAVKITEKAADSFIVDNMIDNNVGGGFAAIGIAGNTLNTLVEGNSFRGNSTVGNGNFPDIYLEQVRNVTFVGNVTAAQQGSTAKTSYAIQTGTGVGFINASGNMWDPTVHTVSVYSSIDAISSRQYRSDYVAGATTDWITKSKINGEANERFQIRADGALVWGGGTATYDTNLFRETADTLATSDMFKAPRYVVNGTAGGGYIYFEQVQSSAPSAIGAGARLYARLNGSSKIELCLQTAGGVQVIATQP